MRVRKLSSTGDYIFGNQQSDFYKDSPETVAQVVKTSLLLWVNEWFLNSDDGTPYMQGVLGKYSKTEADITIQDRVLNIEGVTSIENYMSEINPDNRAMTITLDLNTIYGPTQVQVNNYKIY